MSSPLNTETITSKYKPEEATVNAKQNQQYSNLQTVKKLHIQEFWMESKQERLPKTESVSRQDVYQVGVIGMNEGKKDRASQGMH